MEYNQKIRAPFNKWTLQTYTYAISPMSIKIFSISFRLLSLAIEPDKG